jgi:tripartite-type tricarboxylate transporter receptor subunit TctC
LLIGVIGWVIWRARAGIRAEKMAAVDDAWQTVLSDPNYERRRQQEEHKLNQARSRR